MTMHQNQAFALPLWLRPDGPFGFPCHPTCGSLCPIPLLLQEVSASPASRCLQSGLHRSTSAAAPRAYPSSGTCCDFRADGHRDEHPRSYSLCSWPGAIGVCRSAMWWGNPCMSPGSGRIFPTRRCVSHERLDLCHRWCVACRSDFLPSDLTQLVISCN